MVEIAMTGILFAASYFDWRTEKIPNRLILLGLLPVMGALLQSRDLQEICWQLVSMVGVILICWPFYLMRGLGAGDVKLLALIGGVEGLSNVFSVSVIAFSLAGLFSLAKIFYCGISNRSKSSRRISLAGNHTVILAPFFTLGYVLLFAERWWM